MPLIIAGKKLIPTPPDISIVQQMETTSDGEKIGSTFKITINGTIVPYKGSPDSTGVFWTTSGYPPDETIASDSRQTAIQTKQGAILELLQVEGQLVEIQGWDGAAPIKCNPKVIDIQFQGGIWFDKCDYTITFEVDSYWFGTRLIETTSDGQYIKEASEDWGLEQAEENGLTYKLTHNVSAVGKRHYDIDSNLVSAGWQQASGWVVPRLGLDGQFLSASGVLNFNDYGAYNYLRSQTVDEKAGRFAVQESWICLSGGIPATEVFTVNTTKEAETGKWRVSVEGTVQGYEVNNNSTRALITDRYSSAEQKFNAISPGILTRAENYSETTLNSTPLNQTIGRNPVNGVITYNYEYDNRAIPTVAGAVSESITVSLNNGGDVFARIPVIGRSAGPILQSIGTITEKSFTVNMEVNMPAKTITSTPSIPATASLLAAYIAAYAPLASQVFTEKDEESWNDNTGRYSRTVSYVYQ